MSYPRSLQYALRSLNGYSRQRYKLSPNISQTQSIPHGSTISVSLPENAIISLDDFAWMFKLSTNQGWLPSKHIESIISRVAVEINGVVVDSGAAFQNLLWRKLGDATLGDKELIRNVLQNGVGDQSVAAATTQVTNKQCAIWNWLGFLGSCQPRCIHTGLLGTVRVIITLAGTEVLQKNAAPAQAAGFSLTDCYFTIDTLSINDDVYVPLLKERLSSSENPIELPFTRWVTFTPGQVSTLKQTCTGTLSTESLDMLVGMYQTVNTNASVADLRASDYFKTGSANLVSSSFAINNVNYPQFTTTPADAFTQTLTSMNLAQDTVGACDSVLDSLTKYQNSFFWHALRLNHPTASDERVRSGLNLRGTNSTISYSTDGSDANITPYLFAACTSVLQVRDFKQLNVIA